MNSYHQQEALHIGHFSADYLRKHKAASNLEHGSIEAELAKVSDPEATQSELRKDIEAQDPNSLQGAERMLHLARELQLLTRQPESYFAAKLATVAFKHFEKRANHRDIMICATLFSEMLRCEEGYQQVVKQLDGDSTALAKLAAKALEDVERSTPDLLRVLRGSNESAKIAACQSLKGRAEAQEALRKIASGSTRGSAALRKAAITSLTPSEENIDLWIEVASSFSTNQFLRAEAMRLLKGKPKAITLLTRALADASAEVRFWAVRSLQAMSEAPSEVIAELSSMSLERRAAAATALSGKRDAAPELLECLENSRLSTQGSKGISKPFLKALSGMDEAKDVFLKLLESPEAEERANGAQGLTGLQTANSALRSSLRKERDPLVKAELALTLLANGESPRELAQVAIDVVTIAGVSGSFESFAHELSSRLDAPTRELLQQGLRSQSKNVINFCINALRKDDASVPALLSILEHKDWLNDERTLVNCITALAGRKQAREVLSSLSATSSGYVRSAICAALSGNEEAAPVLIDILLNPKSDLQNKSQFKTYRRPDCEVAARALRGSPALGTKLARALLERGELQ